MAASYPEHTNRVNTIMCKATGPLSSPCSHRWPRHTKRLLAWNRRCVLRLTDQRLAVNNLIVLHWCHVSTWYILHTAHRLVHRPHYPLQPSGQQQSHTITPLCSGWGALVCVNPSKWHSCTIHIYCSQNTTPTHLITMYIHKPTHTQHPVQYAYQHLLQSAHCLQLCTPDQHSESWRTAAQTGASTPQLTSCHTLM